MESVRIFKPMDLDNPSIRDDGQSYSFALNAVFESDEVGIIQNENGNIIITSLPDGYTQIGAIPMTNEEVAIFSTNQVLSEIGIWDGYNYTTHANIDLGFSKDFLIKGIYHTVNGCERAIYWQDGNSPDYFYNFDDPSFFKTGGLFDKDKFRQTPFTTLPQISDITVNDGGGSLLMGTYEFVVETLDENLTAVNRSIISRMVSIYEDSVQDNYDAISGAINEENNTEGLPPTSKNIVLTINNLDVDYPYYRIYVVRRSGGDGVSREVFKKSDIVPISNTTSTYVLRAITNTDTRDTLDKLLIRPPFYEKSKTNIEVDRRHVKANLQGAAIDYSSFQRVTNNILVNWVTRQVNVTNAQERGNSKNPSSYFDTLTRQSDEIYAEGIIYVFKQGFYSPVFHIPGREKNLFDTELITVVDDTVTPSVTQVKESDSRHLGLAVGDTIERWKLFNTCDNVSSMGYYETTTLYPTTVDCNNEPIFGDLAGTPIRHHRMPDRRTIPLIEDNEINLIGVEYSNIVYPHPDIVGHFFVYGERDEFNSTVVDTGYYGVIPGDNNLLVTIDSPLGVLYFRPVSFVGLESDYGFILSPKGQFSSLRGDYLKINRNVLANSDGLGDKEYPKETGNLTIIGALLDTFTNSTVPEQVHRSVDSFVRVEAQTISLNVPEFDDQDGVRNSTLHPVTLVRLEDTLISPILIPPVEFFGISQFYFVSVKNNIEVFTDLFTIRYTISSQILDLSSSQQVFGGDTFISTLGIFGMDGFTVGGSNVDIFQLVMSNLLLLCETKINTSMRYGTEGRCGTIYKSSDFLDFAVHKVALLQPDGNYFIDLTVARSTFCNETYYYNEDYSYLPIQQSFVPLPLTFDYCSKCVDKYPNRVIWSEKTQVEGKRDSFRIFLDENYVIEGENRGEITALHYDNNQLVINCKNGFVVKTPNPQSLQASTDTIYLGTGDFLSIPSRELIATDYGFGGCRNVFSTVRTPRGYVWIDERNGKIFLKSDGFDELTSNKYSCSRWMKSNLPLNLTVQFRKLFGYEYTGRDSRYILGYDPEHERLIVHKVDFKFTNTAITAILNGDLVFEDGVFKQSGGVVSMENQQLFENKSITLSFSFLANGWVSFHSWQPFFMWTGYEKFYTSLEDNNIWSEEEIELTHGKFYGEDYDFIIEYVLGQGQTSVLQAMSYYSQTDVGYSIVDFPTFDRIWAYTSKQSTGIKNIIPLDLNTNPYGNSVSFDYLNVDVIKRLEDYRISKLYDYAATALFSSTQWSDIQSYYNGRQGYIDKVPINHETTPDLYNLTMLVDKYFHIRLFFKNNYRIKFDYGLSSLKPIVL